MIVKWYNAKDMCQHEHCTNAIILILVDKNINAISDIWGDCRNGRNFYIATGSDIGWLKVRERDRQSQRHYTTIALKNQKWTSGLVDLTSCFVTPDSACNFFLILNAVSLLRGLARQHSCMMEETVDKTWAQNRRGKISIKSVSNQWQSNLTM